MSKYEKIVLKYLKKNYSPGDEVCSTHIQGKIALDNQLLAETCMELANKKYLSKFTLNHGTYSFYTTLKSHTYQELENQESRRFFAHSILVPIIVGVSSSLITTFITNLLMK